MKWRPFNTKVKCSRGNAPNVFRAAVEARPTMNEIELIITCENCGHVEHLAVESEKESVRRIEKFNCPGQCSPKFYSYITSEQIAIEAIRKPEQIAHVA